MVRLGVHCLANYNNQNLKDKIKILDPEFGKKHIADGISNLKNFA